MLKPSERLPALTSVWLPDLMRLNDNVTPAGQTAGFLGQQGETERFVGDPALPNYEIEGLSAREGLDRLRMDRRRDLLQQFETGLSSISKAGKVDSWDRLSQQAFDLITSGTARAAFDLSNARGGQYTFKVQASAVADSLDEFEKIIAHFRLRLVLFRFQNMQKDPRAIQELATADFRPVFGEPHEFLLDRFLGSTSPGANFSIGCGLGVMITMETIAPLTLPTDQSRRLAVRLQSVELTFNPRQRDESVSV